MPDRPALASMARQAVYPLLCVMCLLLLPFQPAPEPLTRVAVAQGSPGEAHHDDAHSPRSRR